MKVVSFDLAKKLKEKGFREKVNAYYGKHENIFDVHPALDMNDACYRCSAPTISQVLKWLREEKEIHISVDITSAGWINNIVIKVKYVEDGPYWYSKQYRETEFYNSYEEAIIEAIEYVLDNLI